MSLPSFAENVKNIFEELFNPETESIVTLVPLKVAVPKYNPNEFNAALAVEPPVPPLAIGSVPATFVVKLTALSAIISVAT